MDSANIIDGNMYVSLRKRMEEELKDNILKFWIDNTVDEENGGFYGYVSNDITVDKFHEKSSVLCARILWTFSAAVKIYKEEKYLWMADRAYQYIVENFWDNKNSGIYWMLDYKGNIVDSKKQIYAIAFAIYALSEYYSATGKKESLDKAIELFEMIEKHAYDVENKGYIEALSKDWSIISDMRLSEKDMNVEKSMNTHLHVLEAYTNLLRVWDNERLRKILAELVDTTITNIVDNDNYRFKLFFDKKWNAMSDEISYGHDIEGSWLLHEAAEVLGLKDLLMKVEHISLKMAQKVYDDGIDKKNGGIFNEEGSLHKEIVKDWWPQAEAVVGFLNAYKISKDEHFLTAAYDVWGFIDSYFIDKEYGEWFWGISGSENKPIDREKAGPWKCPYHNGRMSIEAMCRLDKLHTIKKEAVL